MLCYAMLCCAMLCYAMLCYAMLPSVPCLPTTCLRGAPDIAWGAPAEAEAFSAVASSEGSGARALLPRRAPGGSPPPCTLHVPACPWQSGSPPSTPAPRQGHGWRCLRGAAEWQLVPAPLEGGRPPGGHPPFPAPLSRRQRPASQSTTAGAPNLPPQQTLFDPLPALLFQNHDDEFRKPLGIYSA